MLCATRIVNIHRRDNFLSCKDLLIYYIFLISMELVGRINFHLDSDIIFHQCGHPHSLSKCAAEMWQVVVPVIVCYFIPLRVEWLSSLITGILHSHAILTEEGQKSGLPFKLQRSVILSYVPLRTSSFISG